MTKNGKRTASCTSISAIAKLERDGERERQREIDSERMSERDLIKLASFANFIATRQLSLRRQVIVI